MLASSAPTVAVVAVAVAEKVVAETGPVALAAAVLPGVDAKTVAPPWSMSTTRPPSPPSRN